MQKHGLPLTYERDGLPVVSQTYTFEGREAEVVDLRSEIVAEGIAPVEAGVHALAALPKPDAAFVEWLTGGTFTLDVTGNLTADPAVLAWAAGFRGVQR